MGVGGKLTTTTSLSRVKNKTWAIKIKMHAKQINSTGPLAASLGRTYGDYERKNDKFT